MTRTAFVLGGTGQIGRAVCQRLAEAGWEVTVGARRRRAAPSGVRSVGVDRHQPGALERAVGSGTDVLIDVIAFTAGDAEQLNAFAGLVGSVIAISSAAFYTDERVRTLDEATDLDSFPELPVPIPDTQPTVEAGEQTYSTRKVAMERALLEGPLPTTIIRACAIHGPGAQACASGTSSNARSTAARSCFSPTAARAATTRPRLRIWRSSSHSQPSDPGTES